MAEPRTVPELKEWFGGESTAIYGRKFRLIGEAHDLAQKEIDGGMSPDMSAGMTAEGKHNLQQKVAARKGSELRENARLDILALEAAYVELVGERVADAHRRRNRGRQRTPPLPSPRRRFADADGAVHRAVRCPGRGLRKRG